MASTTNGVVTPPAPLVQQAPAGAVDKDSNKRKREDDGEGAIPQVDPSQISRRAQIQGDILEILQQHDTQPSFLEHALDVGNQLSPKKAKLSTTPKQHQTIRSKLDTGAYGSLPELQKDADSTSHALLEAIRAGAREREGQTDGRLSLNELKQIQRVRYLKQVIDDLVEQDAKVDFPTQSSSKELPTTNGDVPITNRAVDAKANTVLTLFGNGPTPRQLFSSRQHTASEQSDPALKTEIPVEELGLPNGLATTNIGASSGVDKKAGPTFEDAFAPPYNLPALQPPKPIRRPTTRDTNIAWEFKDPWSKANKKGGYTVQPLSVGGWLSYGGVDSKEDITSPQERRKIRDRALSSGEGSLPPPSRASQEELLAREEESLFRRAYSSFAPSYDNSKALVSEETRNMVWWHKVGRKRYNEVFALDPALVDEVPTSALNSVADDGAEKASDEDFGQVVDDFTNLDDELAETKIETLRDKTDVDAVLEEISELLQTLASHQRIRNASLPPPASVTRTSISPAPTLASRPSGPDSPADDEIATYQALRREIAYLVLKLPPYAVAKLDGDQLSELGVSRLLTFESPDVKGSMEEDQVSRQARITATATAGSIASLTRSQSGSSAQHYSSTNQRAPAIGQAANTRYGGGYSVSRTPLNQSQYQRSGVSQTSYGTPTATAQRPGYGSSNYVSQTGQARPGYAAQSGQQYYQRPGQATAGGYAGYPQSYQSTPNTQQRPAYSSQPLAPFQNQNAQNAARYQSGQSQYSSQQTQAANSLGRTMSPVKYTTQNPQPIAQRPSFSTQLPRQPSGSDRATPSSFPSQPQTPVNGVLARAPSQGAQQAPGGIQQSMVEGQQPQSNGLP